MRAPSIQWASVPHGSLPAWRTLINSVSTPARSRMVEQVLRYTRNHTLCCTMTQYLLFGGLNPWLPCPVWDCSWRWSSECPRGLLCSIVLRQPPEGHCFLQVPNHHLFSALKAFNRKFIHLYLHALAPSLLHPLYHQERTSLAFHTRRSRTWSRVVLERANAASKCPPNISHDIVLQLLQPYVDKVTLVKF